MLRAAVTEYTQERGGVKIKWSDSPAAGPATAGGAGGAGAAAAVSGHAAAVPSRSADAGPALTEIELVEDVQEAIGAVEAEGKLLLVLLHGDFDDEAVDAMDGARRDAAVVEAASQAPGLVPLQLNADSPQGQEFLQVFAAGATPCVLLIPPPTHAAPVWGVAKVLQGPCGGAGGALEVAAAITDTLSRMRSGTLEAGELVARARLEASNALAPRLAASPALRRARPAQGHAAVNDSDQDGASARAAVAPAAGSGADVGGEAAPKSLQDQERQPQVGDRGKGETESGSDKAARAGAPAACTAATAAAAPAPACMLQLRLLDGSSLRQGFDADSPLADAFALVLSHLGREPSAVPDFSLKMNFPRNEFTYESHASQTLSDLGLTPSATLIVAATPRGGAGGGGGGGGGGGWRGWLSSWWNGDDGGAGAGSTGSGGGPEGEGVRRDGGGGRGVGGIATLGDVRNDDNSRRAGDDNRQEFYGGNSTAFLQ